MNEPLKNGDLCEVIGGLGRSKSPNLGKHVTVGMRIFGAHGADHSQFGKVHRCSGDGIVQLSDTGGYIVTGWADFPDAWLRKLKPPPTSTHTTTKKEITV